MPGQRNRLTAQQGAYASRRLSGATGVIRKRRCLQRGNGARGDRIAGRIRAFARE
jgi:hypothetical protein